MHNNRSPDATTATQQRAEDGTAPSAEATSAVEVVTDKVVEDIVEVVAEVFVEVSVIQRFAAEVVQVTSWGHYEHVILLGGSKVGGIVPTQVPTSDRWLWVLFVDICG